MILKELSTILLHYVIFFCFLCRAPEFDMTELESLFSAVPPKSDQVKLREKSGRRLSLGAKPEKIHLVYYLVTYFVDLFTKHVG